MLSVSSILTARTIKHNNKNNSGGILLAFTHLLGGEVKVESGLKSVKLELSRGEKVPWSRSAADGESLLDRLSRLLEARLLNWSWASLGRSSELLNTSLLVRGVKWVDERVDTGTVSTGRDAVERVPCVGIVVVWGKVGSISVELEVTVSWVMGVDEWVEVGIHWCINIVIVNWLLNRSCLTSRCSDLDRSSRCRGLGNKSSRLLTSSSGGNVSSFQDPESILTSSVSDGDSLAVIINITVLANPFSVSSGFLPKHGSILLCKRRSMSTITSIESLLFQNLSILRLNKLTASGSDKA